MLCYLVDLPCTIVDEAYMQLRGCIREQCCLLFTMSYMLCDHALTHRSAWAVMQPWWILVAEHEGTCYVMYVVSVGTLRCVVGPMPDARQPAVLVSTRLSEVRGFSDFCAEFFQVRLRGSHAVRLANP